MSWFDTKGFASIAKNALKNAQKQIDKALDIQDDINMTGSTTNKTSVNESVSEATEQKSDVVEKKLPGGANRERQSKTEPNTPSVANQQHTTISSNWGSFTGSFFENPKGHEMVTTAPKVSSSTNLAVDIMKPTSGLKRQSVASNSDSQSIELLTPATISPSSELPTPTDISGTYNNSESVELITATTSEIATPDTEASMPESIVIIASSETCDDDEEDTISYNTVMDDTLTAMSINESSSKITTITAVNTSNKQINEVDNINKSLSGSAVSKLVMSLDDSDSTQSFEDVQMNMSDGTLQSSMHDEDKLNEKRFHSPPNSNDEMETTTSSDIEIISNPNGGDSSSQNSTSRASPMKHKKATAAQVCTSRANVQKGHTREPSEISILSEDSQTDVDKLQHRISELNDMLETREQRLLQSERQNAELNERNNHLQLTIETLKHSNAGLDSSAEEYTQRLSALEKKFQLSIRERDSLRAQVKNLKEELQNKIPKDDLQLIVAENNDMIAELRLEGEKLSKEILQQSNIIKKLRAKEKTSDSLLKKNKEELQQQCEELERLKKTLNAKAEMECTHIEAVHRISSEKRKLEDEALTAKKAHEAVQTENKELQRQLAELKEQLRSIEQEAIRREQQLRDEKQQLMEQLEAAELRAETTTQDMSLSTMPLMRQLESLQNSLSQRTSNWNQQEKILLENLASAQARVKLVENMERDSKEKMELMQERCLQLEERLARTLMQEEKLQIALQQVQLDYNQLQTQQNKEISKLKELLQERESKLLDLEAEKSRNEQQQLQQKLDADLLQSQYSTESDTLIQHQQQQLPQQRHCSTSSAESADLHASDELAVLGTSMLDWQVDDLDCISNSGRNQAAPSLIYGMNIGYAGHNTSTLEHLQSLLKQRDGELVHLQWELSRLQAERTALNDQMSQLTMELENLKEKLVNLEMLTENHADLQHRYDALLQMYGEKVERTEELELDLMELKEAYKVQITELLTEQQQKKLSQI